MSDPPELVVVSLIGFGTTSSVLLAPPLPLRAVLQAHAGRPTRLRGGALMSVLAIDLALGSAKELHLRGFDFRGAWFFVGGGFALGASLYFVASRFLERSGAAVRYPSRFREYVRDRERHELRELIRLLAKSDLLRNSAAGGSRGASALRLSTPSRRGRNSLPERRSRRCALRGRSRKGRGSDGN